MSLVNLLVVTALFAAASAWAQADAGTPAPRPGRAAAAQVKKQLGSGKEDDEPPPLATLAPPAAADRDTALLRAVLFAFEPAPTEVRIIAIEDLGLLGDARALNPLAQLVMDPNVAVQLAALRAIGSMQHPRAEAILSNIVRHPSINERVKTSAIDALLYQNTSSSVSFLGFLARGNNFHPTLQQQARRVLLEVPAGRTSL